MKTRRPVSRTVSRPLLSSVAVLLVAGVLVSCRPDPPEQPPIDLVGTWEVLDDPTLPLTRHGQRYTFTADSTVRIFRPRTLGPVSTLLATYDFAGDTLIIRSEFDAEMLLPSLSGDTLTLDPLGGSRPIRLVRVDTPVPTATATPPPGAYDPVYTPPSDVPPEDLRTVPNP